MKKIVIILYTVFSSILSFSQQIEPARNTFDVNDKKTGLWITQDRCWQSFAYYKDGKKDGVSYEVNTHYGTICNFVRYSNGEYVEIFTFNDKTGVLLSREYDFREFEIDLKSPYKDWTWDKAPDRICHSVEYYPNGYIKAEGDLIFWYDSDIEIDSIEYGEWRYYNEDGSIKE